ncbi:MAG TPA: helix-turn-helix domain-containing protein [Xanthobacteraceae bacterium]
MADDGGFTKQRLDWLDNLARDPAISDFAFRVAYVLQNYFNRKKNGWAWPALETIAQTMGRSRSGVKKAIRQLAETENLDRQDFRGRGHSSFYRLIENGPAQDRLNGASKAGRKERVLPRPQNGPGCSQNGPGQDEKRSHAGPQNPLNESNGRTPSRTPSSQAAVRAGAFARKRDVPKSMMDRGRHETAIAKIIGWDCLYWLDENEVFFLCELHRVNSPDLADKLTAAHARWQASKTAGVGSSRM